MLLNGEWRAVCVQTGDAFNAVVPGDVSVDCYRAGLILDPYFGMNYKNSRHILEYDWEYRKSFSAVPLRAGERALLIFKGIDTFSEIYLNGALIGTTKNMFLGYEFDVTDYLKEKNELCVKLCSTLKKMDKIDAEKYFACFNKERIFVRKAQCHFGWDWAPDLPGYGIWDDVLLEVKQSTRIKEVRCVTDREGNVTLFTSLNYNVREETFSAYAATDKLRYTVERTPGAGLRGGFLLEFPVTGAKNFRSLQIENPALWMPNGYGKPNLYSYRVELLRGEEVIDSHEDRFGLREVELIQKPVSESMLGFKFRINGIDVFIKGSNFVPCECFTGTVKNSKYERLIQLAKEANLNMLRIWGGGVYEKDIFYKLCDENGIMVWQDFMFACADIPENDRDFCENVQRECIYQVKRLRNHPCIVYWCGGNEKTGSCGLLKQYGDNLVDITVRGIVEHYDGTRPYIRQSPYSLTDIGNDPESGETHGTAYDIVSLQSYGEFLKNSFEREASFMSECAVMGSCVPESYRKFVPREDLWPMGEIYDDRFCDNPYGASMSFVERQKKMVKMLFGEAHGIDEFAVKSMAQQAEALKVEICNARAKRGRCGGFMNWMFDDIWPTGTWSVVDYYLRPKMAYYTLKREYAPFRAAVVTNGQGEYFGYLFNDTQRDISACVQIKSSTLDGKVISCSERAVTAAHGSVMPLGRIEGGGDFIAISCEGETAYAFTKPFPELDFKRDYGYSVGKSQPAADGRYRTEVRITAHSFARMLHFVLPEGVFPDDDWFDLLPGETRNVALYSSVPVTQDIGVEDYTSSVRRTE